MLKRIFRTILVLSLILGIVIPSNAAVLVSDGSAFVTKSEFDADVNNLSNRMAQLENSLDAKIDSLVSSYITRNGIWNGELQELKTSKVADYWSDFTLAGFDCNYKGKPAFDSSITVGNTTNLRYERFLCVESLSKTGMLFGNIEVLTGYDYVKKQVPTSSGTDGRNYFYANDSDRKSNNPYCINNSEFSFFINDVCVYSVVPVNVGVVRSSTTTSANLYFIPKPGKYTSMFFVSKGDRLYFDYRMGFTPQTQDAQATWRSGTSWVVGSYPGVAIVIDSLLIY